MTGKKKKNTSFFLLGTNQSQSQSPGERAKRVLLVTSVQVDSLSNCELMTGESRPAACGFEPPDGNVHPDQFLQPAS